MAEDKGLLERQVEAAERCATALEGIQASMAKLEKFEFVKIGDIATAGVAEASTETAERTVTRAPANSPVTKPGEPGTPGRTTGARAGAKAGDKEKPEDKKKSDKSQEDVRGKARELLKLDREEVFKVLKKFGAEAVGDLREDQFDEAFEAFVDAIDKKKATDEQGDPTE